MKMLKKNQNQKKQLRNMKIIIKNRSEGIRRIINTMTTMNILNIINIISILMENIRIMINIMIKTMEEIIEIQGNTAITIEKIEVTIMMIWKRN